MSMKALYDLAQSALDRPIGEEREDDPDATEAQPDHVQQDTK
jgi:hypothetical protein